MTAFVLTYHSHNIAGRDYGTNDHVAFAADLRTIDDLGARIVPLRRIAQMGAQDLEPGHLLVGITFDDGPIFDYEDFDHGQFGPQRSFLNIMRDFQRERPEHQPEMNATSFVIASPDARRDMERAEECGYADQGDWLNERWWSSAVATGLLDLGNHTWDHVHAAVREVATASGRRNDFSAVDNYADADREIRVAADYIRRQSGAKCDMFAFPFGHTNEYLVEDYLPGRRAEHGHAAAFGTNGRNVRSIDSVWNLPRMICGHDWRTPDQLRSLLREVR